MARRVAKAVYYRFFTLFGAFATVVTGLKYDEDRSNYFAFFLSIAMYCNSCNIYLPVKRKRRLVIYDPQASHSV